MDVVSYVALLLRLGAEWWKSHGNYGDGILVAELTVQNTPILRGRSGQFQGLFNPAGGEFAISPGSLNLHAQQSPASRANVGVNFSRMREELPRTITDVINGLLRSLGHSVLRAEFEEDMRKIFRTPAL
jgi:hypothetical protein